MCRYKVQFRSDAFLASTSEVSEKKRRSLSNRRFQIEKRVSQDSNHRDSDATNESSSVKETPRSDGSDRKRRGSSGMKGMRRSVTFSGITEHSSHESSSKLEKDKAENDMREIFESNAATSNKSSSELNSDSLEEKGESGHLRRRRYEVSRFW